MPLRRDAGAVVVYVDGAPSNEYAVLSVQQTSGGHSLDSATLRLISKKPNENGWIVKPINEIEIESVEPGGGNSRVIFWGQVAGVSLSTGPDESLIVQAKQSPFHFGEPVLGMMEKVFKFEENQTASTVNMTRGDIVFNPTVRGVVRGNYGGQFSSFSRIQTFLDPASVATDYARRERTGKTGSGDGSVDDDEFWTLKNAVKYLCAEHNINETFIKNPSESDFEILNSADDSKQTALQNFRIPIGTFLPAALDSILGPFGFGWYVKYDSIGLRRIAFFRRGQGNQKTLLLQQAGENLDIEKTNVERSTFNVGYQSLFNSIAVIGDCKLYEGTFELIPAWSSSLDGLDETYTTLGHENYESDARYHRVRRDWVLNESNDYGETRSGISPANLISLLGLGDDRHANYSVPRRRRFLPCITLDTDGMPLGKNGYVVEFKTSSDSDWLPIDQLEAHSFEILTQECGIRFTADVPPYIGTPLTDFKLRITASVYLDDRIEHIEYRDPQSIQPLEAQHVIEAADNFKFAQVSSASKFYQSSTYIAAEVDDTDRIREFAKRLRKTWDQADVSANAVIPWLDFHEYSIGDAITFISGRDIQLSTGSIDGDRFPQVVGINYDCQRHKRTLALEVFRDARWR